MERVAELKRRLEPVFADWDIARAVLFGSQAAGTATAQSDLDLLVDSRLRGLRFVGFMEDIRLAAGIPVDVFDVAHVEEGSTLAREIQETGVVIYEK